MYRYICKLNKDQKSNCIVKLLLISDLNEFDCFGGKLKPWHIPSTAGTHQRLNPGTVAPLSPALGGPGIQMTGALSTN